VNGDAVLLMCGRQLQREGRLKGGAIVATVMSNIGLELALRETGIDLVRCPVGDKYVMEEMLKRDLSLGGEQSGHIIFSDYLFTGDGLCTALNVLGTVAMSGRSLADLASDLTTYPQVLLNVRVREKVDLRSVPAVAAAMADVESRLHGQGRLLVRYSGTEPLLRVMLEGQDETRIHAWAQEIIDVVKQQLG
jgi:phosphoglucosamine mutase